MKIQIRLIFDTPLFCRGSDNNTPEIRSPSIRGQLHWWFRALGYGIVEERAVFGGIKQTKASFQGHDQTLASRVIVRVADIDGTIDENARPVPHHNWSSGKTKAFAPGTECNLFLSSRLGLTSENEKKFIHALKAWLLMGTLGLRSTRAGGSFHWSVSDTPSLACPDTFGAYLSQCREVCAGTKINVDLLSETYTSVEQARVVVSDTLGSEAGHNSPLGALKPQRKTSPLRFKIIKMGEESRILAVWDGREAVTGNTQADLTGIIGLLKKQKPALGLQLADSVLAH